MKQLKIINASITRQRAFEILDQNELKAAYYKVPQGENKELAEAMRLLSGLGYIIQHRSDNRLVGTLINPSSVSTDTHPESDEITATNIIRLFFDEYDQGTGSAERQPK